MLITTKRYWCPVCNYVDRISTNHYGEIYSRCKKCGASQPLQCVEPEANKDRPIITTTLHHYYFNLEDEGQKDEYMKLRLKLQKTRKLFATLTLEPHKTFKKFREYDGKEVHLYSDWVTNNQWASQEGLRIFDWQQAIYPNEKIKEGYYLDITKEMNELRAEKE